MLDRARGARLDLEHVFGPLGWVDAEDGLEEVATGAGGVVLEGGGRERRAVDRRGQVGEADPALEAVVGTGASRPALDEPGVDPGRRADQPVGVHGTPGPGPAGQLALVEVALVDGLTRGPHRGGVGYQHADRGVRREVGQVAGVERAPRVGELRDSIEPPARRPLPRPVRWSPRAKDSTTSGAVASAASQSRRCCTARSASNGTRGPAAARSASGSSASSVGRGVRAPSAAPRMWTTSKSSPTRVR